MVHTTRTHAEDWFDSRAEALATLHDLATAPVLADALAYFEAPRGLTWN